MKIAESPRDLDTIKESLPNRPICFNDGINAMFGETEPLRRVLATVNWWSAAAVIGFLAALAHLLLIHHPNIGYLFAEYRVRNFRITLPEAMATVNALGWYSLVLEPVLFVLILSLTARMMFKVSKMLKGAGSFHDHFGITVIAAAVIQLGRSVGYAIIGSNGFQGISDLRDLTPGVGLGIIPWFSLEQIGLFWHEIVRGCDVFGLWLIFLGTAMFQTVTGFSRLKSFGLISGYYAMYLIGRWFVENPGHWLWLYIYRMSP